MRAFDTSCRAGTTALLLAAGLPLLSADAAAAARPARAVSRAKQQAAPARARLGSRPGDEEAQFRRARALAFQGKTAAAIAEYDLLLRRSPRNADYLLGKAQALVWAGSFEAALPLLRQARRLSPRYEDVYRVEIQALTRLGAREPLAALLADAARRFPRSRWPAPASAPAPAVALRPQEAVQLDAIREAVVNRRYEQAEGALRAWLEGHPRDAEQRFLLARVLAWQGKTNEAAQEYDRLLAAAPRDVDYLLGKAQALMWGDRPAEALPLLETAKAAAPRYEELYRAQIQALTRLRNEPQLAAARKEAMRLFPRSNWIDVSAPRDTRLLDQATVAFGAGDLPQVEQLLREWLKESEKDSGARFLLARVLAWQGKRKLALAEYDRLLAETPGHVDYLLGKAQALLWEARPAEALPLLERARAISPGYQDLYRLEIEVLARMGDRQRLAAARQEAHRLFPNAAWDAAPDRALLEQARLALRGGQLETAERLLREWLKESHEDEEGRYLLARVLAWQGNAAEALAEYERLLALSPKNPDYLLSKAQALVWSDRLTDAVPLLHRAQAASPGYEEVYRVLVDVLGKLGDREQLGAVLQAARTRFPGARWTQSAGQGLLTAPGPAVDAAAEDRARRSAVQAAIRSQQLPLAESLLRSWLAMQAGDAEARFLLARVLTWQGKGAEAIVEFDRLLTEHPKHVDYLFGKAQALVGQERLADAVPLLEQVRALAPRYEDAYRLEVQTLRRLGDTERLARLQAQAASQFPGAPWLVEPRAPAAGGGPGGPAAGARPPAARVSGRGGPELEAGFTYEALSRGFGLWRSYYLEGRGSLGERRTLYGTLRETERFRLRDQELTAGYAFPLGRRWSGLVEGSASPSHRVLPRWSGYGEIQHSLGGGWGLLAGVRRTEYSNTTATRGNLTLERYFRNFRLAYTFSNGQSPEVGASSGHGGQFGYYYGERNFINFNLSGGEELESIGPGRVLRTDVFTVGLNGRHWFRPEWALTYGFGWTRQGDLYTRRGLLIGLRHLF